MCLCVCSCLLPQVLDNFGWRWSQTGPLRDCIRNLRSELCKAHKLSARTDGYESRMLIFVCCVLVPTMCCQFGSALVRNRAASFPDSESMKPTVQDSPNFQPKRIDITQCCPLRFAFVVSAKGWQYWSKAGPLRGRIRNLRRELCKVRKLSARTDGDKCA